MTPNLRHKRKYNHAIRLARRWFGTKFHKRRALKWFKAAVRATKAIERIGYKTYK